MMGGRKVEGRLRENPGFEISRCRDESSPNGASLTFLLGSSIPCIYMVRLPNTSKKQSKV